MTNSTGLRPRNLPDEARGGGVLTLEKISFVMGLFGLAFLVVVSAVSAWNERQTLFREAQQHAQDSAFFLADHAERLFEVSDVALRSTTLAVRSMDWSTVEQSRPLWESLRATNALLPYVGDLWLNDEAGRLRMTTFDFPPPVSNASDRPIFAAVKDTDQLVIGNRIVGKITGLPTFLAARRVTGEDGAFRGMVSASVDLSYFTDYWRKLELPNRERIAVVKAGSGDVLIASAADPDTFSSRDDAAFAAATASEPEAGDFIPSPNLYAYYHRVGILPLYLVVTFDRSGVFFAWEHWMLRLAPLALAAMLALASMMAIGSRQARRETQAARAIAAAREELQAANAHLEERVATRTADLQESNDQIQRYAYIVSHDLRAPLVNIAGFVSELEDLRPALFNGEPPSGATARDFDEALGFIRSSTEKMNRLINAILRLSREGRRTFRPEPIQLTSLLQSIADDVAHQAHKANATILIGDLPVLRSDRLAVEQIFSNLIDNAVKYLGPEKPGRVHVSGERVGDRVVIRVADNGRGIEDKDLERVFELFRRAGPQDRPGEGIGLAHVRALVRRLGGHVRIDSRMNQGSTFSVDLPDIHDANADATT